MALHDNKPQKTEKELILAYQKRIANTPKYEHSLDYFTAKSVCNILVNLRYGMSFLDCLGLELIPVSVGLEWERLAHNGMELMRAFFREVNKSKLEMFRKYLKDIAVMSTIHPQLALDVIGRRNLDWTPKSFVQAEIVTNENLEQLKALVISGSMTANEIIKMLPELDSITQDVLYGVEAKLGDNKPRASMLLVE